MSVVMRVTSQVVFSNREKQISTRHYFNTREHGGVQRVFSLCNSARLQRMKIDPQYTAFNSRREIS